ncbi:MAG: 5-deoxy-glucuronate isomerase [Acidimicrobiales bacterium]
MTGARLHWPAGSLRSGGYAVELSPERAGWTYCGLRVAELPPGGRLDLSTGGEEMAVLPLSGSLEIAVEGRVLELEGRTGVFTKVTDWAYLPIATEATLRTPGGCRVALPSSRATRRLAAVRVAAEDVPVEVRGAGPSTRQVTNFMSPASFGGADRLMCVEVLTPEGNWSSWPPHKHDDSPECPVELEEIYYFGIGEGGGTGRAGFAVHRTYTAVGPIDECAVVGDGDVFCVPRGYHGPSMAGPGYPLYYLNVLAGPGDERTMTFCDDPDHAWIRGSWAGMAQDPRCPLTGAGGPVKG